MNKINAQPEYAIIYKILVTWLDQDGEQAGFLKATGTNGKLDAVYHDINTANTQLNAARNIHFNAYKGVKVKHSLYEVKQ